MARCRRILYMCVCCQPNKLYHQDTRARTHATNVVTPVIVPGRWDSNLLLNLLPTICFQRQFSHFAYKASLYKPILMA